MRIPRGIWLALPVACFAPLLGAQDRPPEVSVRGLMTEQEFQQAGLQKLTAAELAALDAWFVRTAITIMGTRSPAGQPAPGSRALDFSNLEGAIIVANDGEFLGKITINSLDSRSIGNEIGRHGSDISRTSIFNDMGRYGGEIARMSPFNPVTSTPPRIFHGNRFVAYLTVNEVKTPRIDPRALIGWIKANE